MNENLPEPMVPADVDCTDLDGFMLNVERLMASELVALATHEEVAAAIFLWCRAWKQTPAASLPDDDRINAAFARLPLARFRRVKDRVLHGFVKCSDGRLYHRFLSAEAMKAWERKTAFKKRRETDAERLRKWRDGQRGNSSETTSETLCETQIETRFVAEGQGQGQGQLKKERRSPSETAADASASGAVVGEGDDPKTREDTSWCQSAEALAVLTLSGKYNPHHAKATMSEWLRQHHPSDVRNAIVSAQTVAATDPLTYAAKRLANLRAQGSAGVIRTQKAVEEAPWERLGMTREQWEAV